MSLDIERVRYWLGVGAQPTETVKRILAQVKFFFFSAASEFVRDTMKVERVFVIGASRQHVSRGADMCVCVV